MPRSLVFNWKQEAERFTPGFAFWNTRAVRLRAPAFHEYDAVFTTYGTPGATRL
jgi:hypothetical protein